MATESYYRKGSEEYIDAKCSACADKNKDQVADDYCYDCQKHLCKACLAPHDKLKKSHIVVQGNGDKKNELTEKCGKHTNELITMYCLEHKELMCIECRRQDHRTCKDARHVKDAASQLSADPDLQTSQAQLQSALDNIRKAIEALDNDVESIQNKGSGFLNDLEHSARKLLSRIEKLKDEGKRAIKSKQDQLISKAKRYRQDCVLAKDEASRCLDEIKKPNHLKANLFIIKKKSQSITQRVYALHNEVDSFIDGRQFSFMVDMRITDSLNYFKSLVIEVSTNIQDISSFGAETTPYTSKPVRSINIRIPEDNYRCDIHGCCRLSDGCLVMADFNNKRLKLVDPSGGTVTKYCDTDGQPWDVCCIGPQEIAVAFGSTQVHVYSAVNLTQTRTIKLGRETYRIACHGGHLYAAWGSTLVVHDLSDGRKLREISRDTDVQNLVSFIQGIALSGPGDRVFVADWRRGLLCLSQEGQLIFCLSPEKLGLYRPSGVTTEYLNEVFVCGYGSHSVVAVTKESRVARQVLSVKDGIVNPRCLTYDEERSSLYVGGDSDQLLMVELK